MHLIRTYPQPRMGRPISYGQVKGTCVPSLQSNTCSPAHYPRMYTCFKLLSAKHVPLRQLNVRWRQPHDKNWTSTYTRDINNSQGGCSGSTNSFGGVSCRWAMSWFAMLKRPWQMLQSCALNLPATPAWPALHPSWKCIHPGFNLMSAKRLLLRRLNMRWPPNYQQAQQTYLTSTKRVQEYSSIE